MVGQLQFDVLASRVRQEYSVPLSYEPAPCDAARWVTATALPSCSASPIAIGSRWPRIATARCVYLAESEWKLRHTMENWPDLKFSAVRERG